MVSSPILKGLATYLSSVDAVYAVYNESFKLTATDSKEFFEKLDIDFIKSNPPERKETVYPIEVDGKKMALSVTPIFKSKRIVNAYVFVARTDYQLYKHVCAGGIPDYINLVLDRIKDGLGGCSDLNELAQQENASKKLVELLEAQQQVINGLYSEVNGTRCAAFPNKEVNSRLNCNISALLTALCSDTAECLKEVKRKVNAEIDTRNYYMKIDFNLFTAAFSNLIMYHLLCSPLKSPISIKSELNESILELTVKTKAENKAGRSADEATLSKYYCELTNKIICYDFGGEYETANGNGSVVSIIRLPIAKKNRGSLLTDKNSAYLGSDYKPMSTNLIQIIRDETAALKNQKDSKKADKQ